MVPIPSGTNHSFSRNVRQSRFGSLRLAPGSGRARWLGRKGAYLGRFLEWEGIRCWYSGFEEERANHT